MAKTTPVIATEGLYLTIELSKGSKSGAPALQIAVQQVHTCNRTKAPKTTKAPTEIGAHANQCDSELFRANALSGEDRNRTSSRNTEECANLSLSAAKSGAVRTDKVSTDPDLQAIIDAWPGLSDATKATLLRLVR